MPCLLPSLLFALLCFILIKILQRLRCYYYLHFIDEDFTVSENLLTCWRQFTYTTFWVSRAKISGQDSQTAWLQAPWRQGHLSSSVIVFPAPWANEGPVCREETGFGSSSTSLGLNFSICETGLIGPNSQGWELNKVCKRASAGYS